ncbi:protein kinase [Priestia megaterium]|nr:protein kinase [Priestia megaterium]
MEVQTKLPLEILEHLNLNIGLDITNYESLHARQGQTFRLESNQTGPMLIKLIDINSQDEKVRYREKTLRKEANILSKEKEFTNGLYIASGEVDSKFWLLRYWIEGENIWEHSSYIRSEPNVLDNKKKFATELCKMLEKVIQLSKIGYLHGDLQPAHFLVDPKLGFQLIDLELAVNLYSSENDYGGALVHFVPPETAEGMMKGTKKIPLSIPSEIYSFGAVAFFLYTGELPVDYNNIPDHYKHQKLLAISKGYIKSFKDLKCNPFPELELILTRCLDKNKDKRYQRFEELLSDLKTLSVKDDSFDVK